MRVAKKGENEIGYIPYSSWDGAAFWIPSSEYGRDFPTAEDAVGAIYLSPAEEESAMQLWKGTYMPIVF